MRQTGLYALGIRMNYAELLFVSLLSKSGDY